jgi:SNF2 family DNA or RNA helicase
MIRLQENGINGILADEMGLGYLFILFYFFLLLFFFK